MSDTEHFEAVSGTSHDMEDTPMSDFTASPSPPTSHPPLTLVTVNIPWPRLLGERMLTQLRQLESVLTTRTVTLAHTPSPQQINHNDAPQNHTGIFVPSPIAIYSPEDLVGHRIINIQQSMTAMPAFSPYRHEQYFQNQCHYASIEAASFILILKNILRLAPQSVLGGHITKTAAPTTFHPFGRLPAELRIMIWELAMGPLPVCKHFYETAQRIQDFNDTRPHAFNCENLAAAPLIECYALMQACKESRYLTLERKKKVQQKVFSDPLPTDCSLAFSQLLQNDWGDNNSVEDNDDDADDGSNADIEDNADSDHGTGESAEGNEEENEELNEEANNVDRETIEERIFNIVYFHRIMSLNLIGNRLRRRLSDMMLRFPHLYTSTLGPFGMRLVEDLFKVDGEKQQSL